LAVHATALGGGLRHLIGACVVRLRATYGTPGGATVAGLGLTLAGAIVARTAFTATTYLRATGRQAPRHAQTARLIGRQVLPFLPLMRDADQHVARLVELHADDAATRACDPRLLATALVLLATAASPASALAAGATDSVQRIHRLLGPAKP